MNGLCNFEKDVVRRWIGRTGEEGVESRLNCATTCLDWQGNSMAGYLQEDLVHAIGAAMAVAMN